jgi:hypothetical protein
VARGAEGVTNTAHRKGASRRPAQSKLKTVGDILAEMQRLYRGARSGNLPVEERLIKIRGTVEATQLIDHIPGKPGPYVSQIDVTGVPRDWAAIGLLGDQAHVPRTILPRLRELLPPDAFTPLPDLSIPDPIDDALSGSSLVKLRNSA